MVENNQIAQTTRTAETIGGSIAARGQAFGLPVWSVDDADPLLFQRVEEIVAEVRASRQPASWSSTRCASDRTVRVTTCETKRRCRWIRSRDPLARLGSTLDPVVRAEIERRNRRFIADVRTECNASSEARLDSIPAHVFAGRAPAVGREEVTGAGDSKVTVRAALNLSLRKMLANDPDVILLGEDLHDPYGGAFKVTAGLSTEFAGRVISTPISEAGVVGASIGLALAGYRPIAEIMFADFVTLAMDQLYNHAVKLPALSEQHAPATRRAHAERRPPRIRSHTQSESGESDGVHAGPDSDLPEPSS